jgi:hypothetical protein
MIGQMVLRVQLQATSATSRPSPDSRGLFLSHFWQVLIGRDRIAHRHVFPRAVRRWRWVFIWLRVFDWRLLRLGSWLIWHESQTRQQVLGSSEPSALGEPNYMANQGRRLANKPIPPIDPNKAPPSPSRKVRGGGYWPTILFGGCARLAADVGWCIRRSRGVLVTPDHACAHHAQDEQSHGTSEYPHSAFFSHGVLKIPESPCHP